MNKRTELLTEWKDIIPFCDIKTNEIGTQYLPANIQEYAYNLAQTVEVDETVVTMSCLGILATILSSKFAVFPTPNWSESLNLYIMVSLPPGNNKSFILKSLSTPITNFEAQDLAQKKDMILAQKSKLLTEERIIENHRKKAYTYKGVEQESYIAEIAEKEKNITKVSKVQKFFANNITIESLGDALEENNGRFAIISDEGGVLEVLSGMYSNGKSNIDILLQGMNGDRMRIKRQNREIDLNPYLSILLLIQPEIIKKMHNNSAFSGVGLSERFLYAVPKSYLGKRKLLNHEVTNELIEKYESICKDLINLSNSIENQVKLKLSSLAQDNWQEFRLEIEKHMDINGYLHDYQGWASKLPGFTLRIAGLIHVCENYHNLDNLTIDEAVMNKALSISNALTNHTISAFSANNKESINLSKILEWIKSLNKEYFTKSEIVTRFRNSKIKNDLDVAIPILIDHNYLICKTKKTENSTKPTTYYYINPSFKNIKS